MAEIQQAKAREYRLRTIITMFEVDKKKAGKATKPTIIDYDEKKKELSYEISGEKAKIRRVIKNVDNNKALKAIKEMKK